MTNSTESNTAQSRPTMLIFDATNMIHRTFFAQEGARTKKKAGSNFTAAGLNADGDSVSADVQLAGLAHYMALATLNKYFTRYNADVVALAFDRSNWRKQYTKSDQCVSGAVYKGTRRQNMSDAQQDAFQRFCDHITEFEDMARDHTGMVVLSGDLLEADDLIAGTVERYVSEYNIIIVSADQDLLQLLRYDNVTLIDPASGNPRSLSEYNMDADWFLFQKCIRGDTGDNVKSAFPKVRMTRIEKAYTDAFEYDKLMKEEWTNADGRRMVVGQLYRENRLLMDLSQQPQDIRDRMFAVIEEAFANPGKYNHFSFIRYCGKFGLRKVVDSLHVYQRLLV